MQGHGGKGEYDESMGNLVAGLLEKEGPTNLAPEAGPGVAKVEILAK
jgi:hypothetical protein